MLLSAVWISPTRQCIVLIYKLSVDDAQLVS